MPEFKILKWPEKWSPNLTMKEAYIECPSCQFHIYEKYRHEMNKNGLYLSPGQTATVSGGIIGGVQANATVSFWVSGLASPWRTIGEAARKFIVAARTHETGRIQGVINVVFGEAFKVEGEAPDWQEVAALTMPYSFMEVPAGVKLITAGVDLSKDRLYVAVRGWGVQMSSWLLYAGELYGEVDHPPCLGRIEKIG